jgi:hypothetical protein
MKHLIFLILVLITLFYIHKVEASEYMVMQYNENVRIVLSKEKCDSAGFKAVAQRIDKEVIKACWSPNGDKIHIQWEGGDFSEFPLDRFYSMEIK